MIFKKWVPLSCISRPEPFSHPFLSQPVGTGNTGSSTTINMRHRSLDAIPFRSSISANIEIWHWASVFIDYALTSYFYVLPPYRINIVNEPESVQFPVTRTGIDFCVPGQFSRTF